MYYLVSDTGILGKRKSECSYQESNLRPLKLNYFLHKQQWAVGGGRRGPGGGGLINILNQSKSEEEKKRSSLLTVLQIKRAMSVL